MTGHRLNVSAFPEAGDTMVATADTIVIYLYTDNHRMKWDFVGHNQRAIDRTWVKTIYMARDIRFSSRKNYKSKHPFHKYLLGPIVLGPGDR